MMPKRYMFPARIVLDDDYDRRGSLSDQINIREIPAGGFIRLK